MFLLPCAVPDPETLSSLLCNAYLPFAPLLTTFYACGTAFLLRDTYISLQRRTNSASRTLYYFDKLTVVFIEHDHCQEHSSLNS